MKKINIIIYFLKQTRTFKSNGVNRIHSFMQRIFTFEMQFNIQVPAYSYQIWKNFQGTWKNLITHIIIPGTWHVAEFLTQCFHQKVRQSDQQIRKNIDLPVAWSNYTNLSYIVSTVIYRWYPLKTNLHPTPPFQKTHKYAYTHYKMRPVILGKKLRYLYLKR